jgi:hypothetical protein
MDGACQPKQPSELTGASQPHTQPSFPFFPSPLLPFSPLFLTPLYAASTAFWTKFRLRHALHYALRLHSPFIQHPQRQLDQSHPRLFAAHTLASYAAPSCIKHLCSAQLQFSEWVEIAACLCLIDKPLKLGPVRFKCLTQAPWNCIILRHITSIQLLRPLVQSLCIARLHYIFVDQAAV